MAARPASAAIKDAADGMARAFVAYPSHRGAKPAHLLLTTARVQLPLLPSPPPPLVGKT